MRRVTIKQGQKFPLRLPRFTSLVNNRLSLQVLVTPEMLLLSDKCDPGWHTVGGWSLGFNNTFRLVNRVSKGELHFGYYCDVGGVSPYLDPDLMSDVNWGSSIKAVPHNRILFEVTPSQKLVFIRIHNLSSRSKLGTAIPFKGHQWPIFQLNPLLRCPAIKETHYFFKS